MKDSPSARTVDASSRSSDGRSERSERGDAAKRRKRKVIQAGCTPAGTRRATGGWPAGRAPHSAPRRAERTERRSRRPVLASMKQKRTNQKADVEQEPQPHERAGQHRTPAHHLDRKCESSAEAETAVDAAQAALKEPDGRINSPVPAAGGTSHLLASWESFRSSSTEWSSCPRPARTKHEHEHAFSALLSSKAHHDGSTSVRAASERTRAHRARKAREQTCANSSHGERTLWPSKQKICSLNRSTFRLSTA